MNLGIFLSPGDSLIKQSQSGQLERLINYYLRPYAKAFNQVVIFSYDAKEQSLSIPRVKIITKPHWLSNYCYQLCLPLIHYKIIRQLDIFRVFQAPGSIPALISKIFFHKPYVVTYGYDYVYFAKKNQQNLLALALSLVVPLVLKFAKHIIVTTSENQKIARSILIPNGVDPDVFKPTSGRENNLIVSVGRLEPQKRYDLLIKAVSQSRYRSRIELVIIGEGSKAFELRLLAKKLNVKLKLINNLPYLQLVAWYQKATIFALTSDYEGQPKTLIEALSCGCPVLTTNFSGNPITHKLNGLICQQSDLSQGLDKLLADKTLRQQLGKKARELVVNRYNLKQLVKREIQLLLS